MLCKPMDQLDLLDDGSRFYLISDGRADFSQELTRAQVDMVVRAYPNLADAGIIDFVSVAEMNVMSRTEPPTEEELDEMYAAYAAERGPVPVPALLLENGRVEHYIPTFAVTVGQAAGAVPYGKPSPCRRKDVVG